MSIRIAAFIVSLLAVTAWGRDVTLVKEGRPACTIVIPAKPGQIAWYGAWELQQHILKITGAKVPVFFGNGQPAPGPGEDANAIHAVSNGVQILVGDSAASRALGVKGSDFKDQEYGVLFRSNAIVLIGRDEFHKDTPDLHFYNMTRTWDKHRLVVGPRLYERGVRLPRKVLQRALVSPVCGQG